MQAIGNKRTFMTLMGADIAAFESILVPSKLRWNSQQYLRLASVFGFYLFV
jgi:hypothetical protein